MRPPDEVLRAFGATAPPEPLAGGRGTSWRAGAVVLKPQDADAAALEWLNRVIPSRLGSDLRLASPMRALDGRLVVGGWTATEFFAGEPAEGWRAAGRWREVAAAGRVLSVSLRQVARPPFVTARTDAWARADRFAWGEGALPGARRHPLIQQLLDARRPVSTREQLVHADLTGNVLLPAPGAGEGPAVLDLSLYWRPVEHGTAIVGADAVCFWGAPPVLLSSLHPSPGFAQFVVRALLFRIGTDVLHGRLIPGRYRSAVERAVVNARRTTR